MLLQSPHWCCVNPVKGPIRAHTEQGAQCQVVAAIVHSSNRGRHIWCSVSKCQKSDYAPFKSCQVNPRIQQAHSTERSSCCLLVWDKSRLLLVKRGAGSQDRGLTCSESWW